MFDQSYGLRFDIYERIILSEDLPGIGDLEEVELIPHIQVISQEEQATLRGHLLLAGLYKGDNEAGESEPLEHWIPVEITVPLNRVSSLEEIAVEIENFDVDVLSSRSLNITGVLSLKGIQAAVQGPNAGAWNDEEIMVVHAPEATPEQAYGYDELVRQQQAGYSASTAPADPFLQTQNSFASDDPSGYDGNGGPASFVQGALEQELHREQATPESALVQTTEQPAPNPEILQEVQRVAETNPNVWNFERVEKAQSSAENPSAGYPGLLQERQENAISELQTAYDEVEASTEEQEDITAAQETSLNSDDSSVHEEPPSKPELKVAFSTKNSTVDNKAGVGLSSLLQSSRTLQEQEVIAREPEEPVQDEAEQLAAEDVQWKSLFLGSRQEETPFRKVRLCIVQREETIEAIAERYQLSPRELLLYNRLSEQSVEEGQVLYIP
ncbi:LysM peptidoglycan-binding domain-containing protein [Paenibacillus sp. GCM10028914]|uniref:LysM peptidoglycan-binding domain-containing protein n=1 Tax=Paenibacillus sp. GCM10028914 TaxID=3273416 RepID=UPI00361285C2